MNKNNNYYALLRKYIFSYYFIQGTAIGVIFLFFFIYWNKILPYLKKDPRFQIETQDFICENDVPEWINGDIVKDVLREHSISSEDLTVFNKNLKKELKTALENHPWVESVQEIHWEYPSRIRIFLTYRKPFAWVFSESEKAYCVDKNGVLLHYVPEPKQEIPMIRIEGVNATPQDNYGSVWDNPSLKQTLDLWLFLQEKSPVQTKIEKITVQRIENNRQVLYQFLLTTTKQGIIQWGTFSDDKNSEVSKRTKLVSILNSGTFDSLDENSAPFKIDADIYSP